jgi:hypothetical protein
MNAAGKVVNVKTIDNDLSWGKDLRMVEVFNTGVFTRPEDAIHLPRYLPPVVDKQSFDAVMSLNRQALSKKMGGLLTSAEIDAATERLTLVQNHLQGLQQQNRILGQMDEWSSPEVTRLLLEKKNGKVTSYIAREMKTIDKAAAKGTLMPYPQDRLAQ